MKITKIDVMKFDPYDNDKGFACHFVGIRVFTDTGLYGDGEVALDYGCASNAAFGMLQDLCPLVIGMDPLDTEVIWEKLFRSTFWAQSPGPVVTGGMSAIDLACWDIKGKYFGVPVYKLLGGKLRNKLRAYASQLQFGWDMEKWEKTGMWTVDYEQKTLEDYVNVSKKAVSEGYNAIKIDFFTIDEDGRYFENTERLGLLDPRYRDVIERRIAAVREAVGPNVDIIMENHSFTDAQSAVQLGKIAEKYNIFYFEEPNTPAPKTTKFIADSLSLPIAHGERIYTRWQFAPYFENGSIHLIQPDLGTCGGLTEGKKICDMAYIYDVGVQCHVCASPLSTNYALHLECTLPNFVIHEHHVQYLTPEVGVVAKYNLQPVNGYFTVPDLPGFGNEWSEWALEHCKKVTIE